MMKNSWRYNYIMIWWSWKIDWRIFYMCKFDAEDVIPMGWKFSRNKNQSRYMKKQFGGNENESIEYEPVWAGVLADYYNNWDSADIFRLGSYRDSWQNNGMVRLSKTINEQARLNNIENIILVVADIGGHWIARWKGHFNKKFSRLHCSWENLKMSELLF